MQLQEQVFSALAPFESIGLDILSLVELTFFFVVGYLVLQRSRKVEGKVLEKEVDEPFNAAVAPTPTTSTTQTINRMKKKTRRHSEKVEAEGTIVEPESSEATQEVPREYVQSMQEEPVAESTWQTVTKKTKKRLAQQQEQDLRSSAMHDGTQAQCSSNVRGQSWADVSDSPTATRIEKDTDSTPSTRSQPDEDSLPEMADVDSRSVSDSEVQELAVQASPPSQLDRDGSPEAADVESQSVSMGEVQDVAEVSGACQISTPEITPRTMENTSMQQQGFFTAAGCGGQFGQEMMPAFQDDLWQAQQGVQVEAWMPVAIPMEYINVSNGGEMHIMGEQSCFFNGYWQNNQKESIMIEGFEIKFANGPVWRMKDVASQGFTVELNGTDYHAEIALGGRSIFWSDGDVWTCMGPLQHERTPIWITDPSQMDCIMNTAEQCVSTPADMNCVNDVQSWEETKMDMPRTGTKAGKGDDWRVCWEWNKSKYCRKGAACEWLHPAVDDQAPQQWM